MNKNLVCTTSSMYGMQNAYSGSVQGHPLIEIPLPHEAEHPGLAQFTTSSIIPCLRFYSFTFRTLVLFALALLVISRPLFRLIHKYGAKAPEVFRNQTGFNSFNANFRSNQHAIMVHRYHGHGDLTLLERFILLSVDSWY